MSEETGMTAFENALSSLTPLAGRLDRDQLMFQAGQATTQGRKWVWPSATAVLGLVAAVFGGVLALRPEPADVVQVVHVPVKESTPLGPAQPSAVQIPWIRDDTSVLALKGRRWVEGDYVSQRDYVLRWGVDAMHSRAPATTTPRSVPLEDLIGVPEDVLPRPGLRHVPTGPDSGEPL